MSSRGWRWLASSVIHAIHDRQLAEHGGSEGVRDEGGIESALHRPVNLAEYRAADASELAAAYAFGLVKNYGFVDGNKRSAWIAARLFLANNGYVLTFNTLDAIQLMEEIAAGLISESDVAAWFRDRVTRQKAPPTHQQ